MKQNLLHDSSCTLQSLCYESSHATKSIHAILHEEDCELFVRIRIRHFAQNASRHSMSRRDFLSVDAVYKHSHSLTHSLISSTSQHHHGTPRETNRTPSRHPERCRLQTFSVTHSLVQHRSTITAPQEKQIEHHHVTPRNELKLTDFGGSFMYGVDNVRPCESV